MKVLLNEEQIRQGVARIANHIQLHYAAAPVTILAVMTGSVVLLADLIRQLNMPLRVGVLQASSYRGGKNSGGLVINQDFMPEVAGHDVLLVDDIFDTGRTLQRIVELVLATGARSVRTAVLLRKTGCQKVSLVPDFIAFEIPDEFVVGYGLDYRDAFRNLPYVAALSAEDLADGTG